MRYGPLQAEELKQAYSLPHAGSFQLSYRPASVNGSQSRLRAVYFFPPQRSGYPGIPSHPQSA
jgi:hypothetical protein